jgi:hypothetical protein
MCRALLPSQGMAFQERKNFYLLINISMPPMFPWHVTISLEQEAGVVTVCSEHRCCTGQGIGEKERIQTLKLNN